MFHQRWIQPVNDEGRCPFLFCFENAHNSIRIANRADFGVGHDQNTVRGGDGISKSTFDTGWRINNDEIKVRAQVVTNTCHIRG